MSLQCLNLIGQFVLTLLVTIKLMGPNGVFSQGMPIASGCEWNAHNLEFSQHMDRVQP